jgi:hypothetical protein
MFAAPPVNGHSDQILDLLLAQPLRSAQESASCTRPRLPNGDNGDCAMDSCPGPRLPNGDNGGATMDSSSGPRLPNGENGGATMEACPGPRSPNGENGGATMDSRSGPRLPNGENGAATMDSYPGPRLPNGDNGGATMEACPGPRSPNGENGAATMDSYPGPRLPNGDNGGATMEACPGPRSPNGENGETVIEPNGRQLRERDHNGRFIKGNLGGPGNPFARRLGAFRTAMCESATDQDIKEITRILLTKARAGDLAAIKILFAYVIGKPAEAVDPDTLDFHEWKIFQQAPVRADAARQVLDSVPTSLFCLLLRFLLPLKEDQMRDDLIKKIRGEEGEKPVPASRCA